MVDVRRLGRRRQGSIVDLLYGMVASSVLDPVRCRLDHLARIEAQQIRCPLCHVLAFVPEDGGIGGTVVDIAVALSSSEERSFGECTNQGGMLETTGSAVDISVVGKTQVDDGKLELLDGDRARSSIHAFGKDK